MAKDGYVFIKSDIMDREIKIFDEKSKDKEEPIYIKLVNENGKAKLVECDIYGDILPCGYILEISKCGIMMCPGYKGNIDTFREKVIVE